MSNDQTKLKITLTFNLGPNNKKFKENILYHL